MKKKNVSLLFNLLIVVLELVSFYILYKSDHGIEFKYYTEDSNILGLVSSLIFVIYILLNKKIPKWLSLFKYSVTIGLSLTILMVIFVLIPMADFDFYGYLIEDAMLYQHVLCPVLAIISFICFDDLGEFSFKDNFLGLIITGIYPVVLILLTVFNQVQIPPYPFLDIKNQSIIEDVLWFVGVLAFAYLIAYILRTLYIKYNNKKLA